MAQAVDFVVDRGVLVDVRVRLLDVRLGLVVVVVGDEVLDRVVGKEALELLVQLGGERLVVREDERRLLNLLDHPRDGVGLPRAGDTEQCLPVHPSAIARRQLFDCLGLVARGVERGVDAELAVDVWSVDREGAAGVAHCLPSGWMDLSRVVHVKITRGKLMQRSL